MSGLCVCPKRDCRHIYPATCSSEKPRGDRQHFRVLVHLKRVPLFFEINIILALFLISSLSFGIFKLPADELGSRMEAGLSNLLNAVAYKWFVADHLYSPYI